MTKPFILHNHYNNEEYELSRGEAHHLAEPYRTGSGFTLYNTSTKQHIRVPRGELLTHAMAAKIGLGKPPVPKVTLRRVKLRGDYDSGGRYYGSASPGNLVYEYDTDDWNPPAGYEPNLHSGIRGGLRARDRKHAKELIRKEYPMIQLRF